MEYTVKRAHLGDKWYNAGDTREAEERDVQHLVKAGVLVPSGEGDDVEPTDKLDAPVEIKVAAPVENKPDAPAENKAAAKASNKASQGPETKTAE